MIRLVGSIYLGCESGFDPAQQWPFHWPSTTFRSTNTNHQHVRLEEIRTDDLGHYGIVMKIKLIENKIKTTLILGGVILALAIAVPAFAQYSGQGSYGARGEAGWGAYNNSNHWHDAYRWHQNDPDFFYANHLQWISWQPNWPAQDGAYDAQHELYYGQWWYNQNPTLASTNHPDWITKPRNRANHSELQDHRIVMRTENKGNQPNLQQQVSIQQNPSQRVAVMCVLLLALRNGLNH
jgi:hypothetical protein